MPDYNAAITSQLFWVQETRTVARLIKEGVSDEEILRQSVEENIFGAPSLDRQKKIASTACRRLHSLPEELVNLMATGDIDVARLINLLAIMKTNDLFGDFMTEVFKQIKILGIKQISSNDVKKYLDEKRQAYEDVQNISEASYKKIQSTFIKLLVEAGLVESSKTGIIVQPYIDYQLKELLETQGYRDCLFIITGE